jgi:hypothetical protein
LVDADRAMIDARGHLHASTLCERRDISGGKTRGKA